MTKRLLWAGLVVFAAGWLWFVWPTPWVVRSAYRGDERIPVRVNRFTGKTQILWPNGYH